ncbi:hypothetical protein GGS23DRAFT_598947 [Durotheca rogersii]|uniref:uncharacterized protein n=1 Tax=Durotheca rogersii TaxID=419775 RepID=UPI00221EDAA4|nr:uncharacterized protein GGS23DRAFT_598947 [Durotheca rogersii]KAI5861069.1 hypothetical protein GGS23DRAFT_598947 [Durotheca rogersii]
MCVECFDQPGMPTSQQSGVGCQVRQLDALILCTAALFLSGYVIQQRTLRDLRAAIRPKRVPRPSPKVYYLPDDSPVAAEQPIAEAPRPQGHDDFVVIRPSLPGQRPRSRDASKSGQLQPVAAPVREEEEEEEEDEVGEREDDVGVADAAAGAGEEQEGGGGGGNDGNTDGIVSDEKPISRAERRRRIKEEIRRLSEGMEPVYYQRRLW